MKKILMEITKTETDNLKVGDKFYANMSSVEVKTPDDTKIITRTRNPRKPKQPSLREIVIEGFKKINARVDKIEETLAEHSRILAEHSRILEEHSRILEEHSRILEEHTKILERHSEILDKHSEIFERNNLK
jgi:hypothetical protein